MSVDSRRALGSRYELVDRLGGGAMGEVWRTWDRVEETWVAAKRLRPELTSDPLIVTRFVQERSILLSLDHPGILRVRDLVVEGEDLALVMDLVEGPDLGTHLRERGTLAVRDAVEVTVAVLDALVAAHAAGCLHRDVKPDNVLLPSTEDLGAALLGDFGIARLAQESTVQATGLLGTPGYMPPELFTEGSFSAASDVYATGVLLYELLAGRTPFSGPGTAHTVGYRHVHSQPPRLSVPDRLWHVLSTMLAKDPGRRLPAATTAAALRDLHPEVLAAPALPVQEPPDRWEEVPSGASTGPVRVQVAPADLDPGATNLHAALPSEQTFAGAGEVVGLVGRQAGPDGLDDDQTRLGTARPEHVAPRLEPAVVAPAEVRRRRLPWVVGGLLAIGAVVGGLVLTGVVGGSADTPAASGTAGAGAEVEADTPPVDHASGLTTELLASYDDDAGRVDLTLALDTARTPLGGELLLVLPAADGALVGCPQAQWADGLATSTLDLRAGLSIPCGWRLDPGTIDGTMQLDAAVFLDLDAVVEAGQAPDTSAALQAWLASADEATATALEQVDTGYEFIAQRLEGISVRVDSVVRNRPTVPVPYTVVPVWSSGEGATTPLFRSPLDGRPTQALIDVAGGSLDGVRVTTCRAVAVQGVDLLADTLEPSCFVEVEVGELSADAGFSVSGSGR